MLTDLAELAPAALAGLGGAAHCAAMCGPMTLALDHRRHAGPWRAALTFNGGRIVAYGLGGTLAGAVGHATGVLVPGPALALLVRLSAAALLALVGISLLGLPALTRLERGLAPAWTRLRRLLAPLLRGTAQAPAPLRPLLFGLLWVFMPCGLVYSMLLVAASRGSALEGGLVMVAFGIGTAPAVLSLSLAGATLSRWLAAKGTRRLLGVLLLCAAALGAAVALMHQGHGGDLAAHHHHLAATGL